MSVLQADVAGALKRLAVDQKADIFSYLGTITRGGYDGVSDLCDRQAHKRVIFLLVTSGGDPDAGFRIARALQHHYEHISILVPQWCKSAGTLVCIGANELVLGNRSELGPLDIQLPKKDELGDLASGLDTVQALAFLQQSALDAFYRSLMELKQSGLGTQIASEIASRFATQLIAPVYSQIDPVRLGELQRKIRIASDYGQLLNEWSENLKTGALGQLVTSYCSHGFVIDRKEARKLFKKVRAPDEHECKLAEFFGGAEPSGAPHVLNLMDFAEGVADGTADESNVSRPREGGVGAEPEVGGPSRPGDSGAAAASSGTESTAPERAASAGGTNQAAVMNLHRS